MTSVRRWRSSVAMVAAAAVVLIDEIIKGFALRAFPAENAVIDPSWLEFAIHKNYGIAFDIPFKLPLVVLLTLIVLGILVRLAIRNWKEHPDASAACVMIIVGAIGNLYDRLIHQFTVDYIILFGRSAINLSDAVIVIGVVQLLFAGQRVRREHQHV